MHDKLLRVYRTVLLREAQLFRKWTDLTMRWETTVAFNAESHLSWGIEP